MYSDKLLLLKLDDIQGELYQLNNSVNISDSLVVTNLSDMSTSLSDISSSYLAYRQDTLFGVSWDVLLPALISTAVTIIVFALGNFYNRRRQRKQKQEDRTVVKDTIVIWAKENIPILRKYIESIISLAEDIKKSDELQPQVFKMQHITIDVLSQFTIDRLTDSLHHGIKDDSEVKGAKLNDYLSCVSFLVSKQQEVLNRYNLYNSQCNQFMLEWNESWQAYTLNVAMNLDRLQTTSNNCIPQENIYYDFLETELNKALGSSNPKSQFSVYYNLMGTIYNYNIGLVGQTTSMIKTVYMGNDTYRIARQIVEMKKYGDLFSDSAEIIEKKVNDFEQVINYYEKHEIKF